MRGVRLASLARVLEAKGDGPFEIRSADPLLFRLARTMVAQNGLRNVRVTCCSGLGARLASKLEPLAMAAWWFCVLAMRWMFRGRWSNAGGPGTLLLEPCVAGARNPSVHNWGGADPVAALDPAWRMQVPIGFGLRPRRIRKAVGKIRGGLLAEDVMDARAWRSVLRTPFRAARAWPASRVLGGVDLGSWSLAMRRRLIWSTTLQGAAMIEGAVASMARRGVAIDRAVCWFENQPQERAFALAVRRNFAGVRLFGFLQYHFSRFVHAGILPTRAQFEAGVLPDEIACTGRIQLQWLQGECPWQRFVVSGLRRLRLPEGAADPRRRVALVVAPSDDHLASRMNAAARGAAVLLGPTWSVLVRAHPANRVETQAPAGPLNFGSDASPSMESAIQGSSVVVGGAGSGVVLARAAGWPVVILTLPGEIDADPFPANHGLAGVLRARDSATLAGAIMTAVRALPLNRAEALFE